MADNELSRSLHGRIIQKMNQDYMLPTDAPEVERLDRQHRMLFLANEALCWPMEDVRRVLAPRDTTTRILDVGSGSGRWTIEMAKEYPHSEVLGIDLAPKQPSDTPENCRFEVLDVVNHDISHLYGMYDVVHCRAIGGGIRHYQSFLERATRMVKPGGIFLNVEADFTIYDELKCPAKPAYADQKPGTDSWVARITFEVRNRVQQIEDLPPTGWGPILPKWFGENSRLENIKQKSVYIPIGWQGRDDNELANREEVGQLMLANMLDLVQSFRPGLLAAGMGVEEMDRCIQEIGIDLLQRGLKSYTLWHYCTAHVIPE